MKPQVVEMARLLLPGEANALGAAFGGSVVGWIDMCAAIAAQRHCRQTVVTASMDDLHFHQPIKVGYSVTVRARVIAAFNTSLEVGCTVHAEDPRTGIRTLTCSALLTFVALDAEGTRLKVPPLELETEAEKNAASEAVSRRNERLARKGMGQSWLELLNRSP
ncbi:MAG: acyl-CoA thioesterase [Archangiaceae bacterium]|nr:acyl-CoA thioesterase [Archangiaceae bacterium]